MGAACDVPPPTKTFWSKMMRTPVNGSDTAETSGTSRRSGSSVPIPTVCQSGRPNSVEAPPAVPRMSGLLYQDCSESHVPWASVDSLVPPTTVISGMDATASTPTWSGLGSAEKLSPFRHSRPARSPEALNAVVPLANALASASRTGVRSAAVNRRSQPHPIEKLQTAPGNCRSVASISPASFSNAPPPSLLVVVRALTRTSFASGATA